MTSPERATGEPAASDLAALLQRAAAAGPDGIEADDRLALRRQGLYEHKARDGFFMLRVKITQGILTTAQAATLASIARDFGRGIVDVTTRQCAQIHWLRPGEVPEVFDRLAAVELKATGGRTDPTRNIVGNALAGLAADEIVDAYGDALRLHEHFLEHATYADLPRKFKISINGRPTSQGRGLINCVALQGAIHPDGTKGYDVLIGGGLASAPRMARPMDVFVSPEELPEVVGAIAAVFRDSDENQSKRARARVKFVVDALGPDGYRAAVVENLGWEPRRAAPLPPEADHHDHIGVTAQQDGAHSAVGLCVKVGRMTATQLTELVALAREYSTRDQIRLTSQQNVLLPWIPNGRVDALLAEPLLRTLTPTPAPFLRNTQSCTGMEFCGLAKVWTRGVVEGIVDRLDERFAGVDMGPDFRFHYAGCSASCAQHQIADLGIEGTLKRMGDELVHAMDVRIGGTIGSGHAPRFNEVILERVPWWDLEPTLHAVVETYVSHRASADEGFRAFTQRVGLDWWREHLTPAGTPRPAGAPAEMLPAPPAAAALGR